MKICERIQHRLQHLARFRYGERPFGEDRCHILLGVLHHCVDQPRLVRTAASAPEHSDQVGMSQLGGPFPSGQLQLRLGRIGLNELDRGISRLRITALCKENGALFTAPQEPLQAEAPVDDLAFPPFPVPGHDRQPPVT
jgi:hypothetical protein